MFTRIAAAAIAALAAGQAVAQGADGAIVSLGPRPHYLVDVMDEGALKDKLASCHGMEMGRRLFSIGHRGAPLMFPEHTRESYVAAARMGAGILECDVTFTADRELVCRHAQNDLHTTTNILVTDLAGTCVTPFTPAEGDDPATAECRSSEITLAEFRTLTPKMDASDPTAATPEEFLGGTADFRTDLYATPAATLMTHAESIELFRALGVKFTPELKDPAVEMPFDGFSLEDYAQKMIDEYKAAGVPPADVWPQSFDLDVIRYWIKAEPEFGAQAVYLDDRYEASDDDEGAIDPMNPTTFRPTMGELHEMGVRYIAPPLWMLVTVLDGKMVPSPYAAEAKAAGLTLITWTLERSGPLSTGGGWYYQSVSDMVNDDGDMMKLLDVLAQDVGVAGVFSDWPATTTYYANCMGIR